MESAGPIPLSRGRLASKFEIPARKMSQIAVDDVRNKTYLYRKLAAGFVEGVDMFCCEGPGSTEAYTSVQCKINGSLLHLAPEKFLLMRRRDPELCVALLLSATSSREVLRRSHVLNRFEPGRVEIVNGWRRKFTEAYDTRDLELESQKNRFDLKEVVASVGDRLHLCAIDVHGLTHSEESCPANIIDRSGTAVV